MLQTDLSEIMRRHLLPREADVVSLRFGLADGNARTVRQVGEDLGLSYATTKHLLFKALNKMRKPHVAIALRDYLSSDADFEVAEARSSFRTE